MGSVFPSSRVSMQFSGYYNEQTGHYFAMEDPDAAVKEYQVGGQEGTLKGVQFPKVGNCLLGAL